MAGRAVALLFAAAVFGGLTLAAAECDDGYKVTGGGSNALGKFVSDSVANATQDANYKGVTLPFYTVGSGQGVQGWLNATFDYTIIDYPLSSKDYKTLVRPVVQFPLALGAVTAFYNIPGYEKSTLRLSGPVAAGIWSGTIKTWDDPAILAINPNLTKLALKPATPITVFVRNDSAAATGAWTRWLNVSGNGTWTLGVNNTITTWPKTFKSVGSGTNLGYGIGNTTFSIGVLDGYTGKRNKALNDSALQTASNTSAYLRFNKADYNLTDLGTQPPLVLPGPTEDWGDFNLINLGGKATFPVITQATVVTASDLSQLGDRGRAQKQTFAYMLGPTVQSAALNYQEFNLPAAFLQRSSEAVSLIKTAPGRAFYQTVQLPLDNGQPINLA